MPPRAKNAEEIAPVTTAPIDAPAPDDWEFETVIAETPAQVKLDVGDSVILQYLYIQHVENPNKRDDNDEDDFDLIVFRGRDGELYSINPSAKLEREWGKVPTLAWVRITLKGELPSKKGNPFKDYKVEVAKNR